MTNEFVKVLRDEPDSQVAADVLTYGNNHETLIYTPTLFEYKVTNVAIKTKVDLADTLYLLDYYKQTNLILQG